MWLELTHHRAHGLHATGIACGNSGVNEFDQFGLAQLTGQVFLNYGDFKQFLGGEFIAALSAEGIPSSSGYGTPLSDSEGLKYVASKYPDLIRRLPCPNIEKACAGSVWFGQNILLGSRDDMNDIVEAVGKIHKAFRANATPVS